MPFVISAGKALDEKKTEVRVRFKPQPGFYADQELRNEFVMTLEPSGAEHMTMGLICKQAGQDLKPVLSEMSQEIGDRCDSARACCRTCAGGSERLTSRWRAGTVESARCCRRTPGC